LPLEMVSGLARHSHCLCAFWLSNLQRIFTICGGRPCAVPPVSCCPIGGANAPGYPSWLIARATLVELGRVINQHPQDLIAKLWRACEKA
jgi:hypothetical protein